MYRRNGSDWRLPLDGETPGGLTGGGKEGADIRPRVHGLSELKLRKASLADAEVLFEWRNDPLTRAMSGSADEVAFGAHLRWIERKLSDPACRLYVAELDRVPGGTIRFDGNGDSIVSWTVAPSFRGRGLCKQMARLGLEREGRVTAHVHADNRVCRSVLAAVGFALVEDGDTQLWVREAERRRGCA